MKIDKWIVHYYKYLPWSYRYFTVDKYLIPNVLSILSLTRQKYIIYIEDYNILCDYIFHLFNLHSVCDDTRYTLPQQRGWI